MHCEMLAEPSPSFVVPLAHGTHAVWSNSSWYVPSGQETHVSPLLKVPGEQMQSAIEVDDSFRVPLMLGHAKHPCAAPSKRKPVKFLNVPTAQGVHSAPSCVPSYPSLQTQSVIAMLAFTPTTVVVPVGHTLQFAFPLDSLYSP